MVTLFERKVLRIGDSLGVTIPDDIVKTHGIKKGTTIVLVADGIDDADGFLLVDLMGRDFKEIWKLMRRE